MRYTNFNENENDVMNVPATVVDETDGAALMGYNYQNVLEMADKADKMVVALNRIMIAALKITTYLDWVNIGGKPYLQESGATKVARLFGVSWRICDGYPKIERNAEGYPKYTYRMLFTMGAQTIEAEGMRDGKDEFFVGKKKISPDELDERDVKLAAYTNCLNNGIKRIVPGLRNIDIANLEAAGIDTRKIKGYTFKEGTQGGNSGKAEDSGLTCADCGAPITQSVASFSEGKFGRRLCMDCQKKQGK
jgi:hypothetical protein